ncbi:efflux transporter outer membrane subunit [Rubritalea marina]|uniref:efflux transporter outer membrane subunit n=1 Tax=Rubritalea marina TaxID=361055 RepID=UPI00035E421D|nr:efflux transporter outer membrane subunit [Rubritalea marina]
MLNRHLPTYSVIVAAAFLLGACAELPSNKASQAGNVLPLPKRYDATQPPVPQVANNIQQLFSDAALNQHIADALRHNPELRLSAARLEEAGFNTRSAKAGLSPQLNANVGGGPSRSNPTGLAAINSESYTASLDAQWEIDVWGRIRSGIDASSSDQAAIAADLAAARQSIAAQTAQAYFQLLRASTLLQLSEERLVSFQNTLNHVNRRFEAGTANLGSLDLARTDLESTRSQVAQLKDERDQAARSLAILTGKYPSNRSKATRWPTLKRSVPANIPSTVMMQRPDIDAAYQRIRAADSRVNVAHKDLYPSFSLTAGYGRQSSILEDLARSNFNAWSIVGNVSAPLIDGGRRRAELGAANARAKQALATYQSTVLNAFQEVENALGSESYLRQQFSATSNALKAAERAEARGMRSYDSGLINILDLLEVQRRTFNTEEALINLKALRYQNRVSLALALGKAL